MVIHYDRKNMPVTAVWQTNTNFIRINKLVQNYMDLGKKPIFRMSCTKRKITLDLVQKGIDKKDESKIREAVREYDKVVKQVLGAKPKPKEKRNR